MIVPSFTKIDEGRNAKNIIQRITPVSYLIEEEEALDAEANNVASMDAEEQWNVG